MLTFFFTIVFKNTNRKEYASVLHSVYILLSICNGNGAPGSHSDDQRAAHAMCRRFERSGNAAAAAALQFEYGCFRCNGIVNECIVDWLVLLCNQFDYLLSDAAT